MKIKFVGQSTFILNINDKIILTDPWFGKFLRKVPSAVSPDNIDRCDIMLVSHSHIDHLDKSALKLAERSNSTFVGSVSSCNKAKKINIKNIIPMKPDDKIETHNIIIHSIKAYHTFSKDALCFVIENEKNVFFSGDTRLNEDLIKNLKNYKIDIAIVQICCAYYPKKDGMDLKDAIKLVGEIKPEVAIPMHYHMYLKSVNPQIFKEKLKDENIKVDILGPGDEREYI